MSRVFPSLSYLDGCTLETVKFTHRTDNRHAEVIGSRTIPQDISTDLLVCCIGLYDKMLESPCRPDWQQLF
jgi:hypothetical protein